MGSPTDTAINLIHRAEGAVRRRRRREVPAAEATLTSLAAAPHATVALTEKQQRQLAAADQAPVATS